MSTLIKAGMAGLNAQESGFFMSMALVVSGRTKDWSINNCNA